MALWAPTELRGVLQCKTCDSKSDASLSHVTWICRAPSEGSVAHCHSVVSSETVQFTESYSMIELCVVYFNLKHGPELSGPTEARLTTECVIVKRVYH